MLLKFRLETKIIFGILALIIIGAVIFVVINYRKLKKPVPVPQNTTAQVKGAYVPVLPRGN